MFISGEASFSGPKGEQGSPGLNGLRGNVAIYAFNNFKFL